MPDTWIDDHTGPELSARPGFEAHLRRTLTAELAGSAPHRARWTAVAGLTAAAALAATVVVLNRDDRHRIRSADTSTTPSAQLAADLVVFADGAPVVVPEVIATVPFGVGGVPADGRTPLVAMLADAILVFEDDDPAGGLSGQVLVYDRTGRFLRTVTGPTLRIRPMWLGADPNGVIYMVMPPTDELTVSAYRLEGNRLVSEGTASGGYDLTSPISATIDGLMVAGLLRFGLQGGQTGARVSSTVSTDNGVVQVDRLNPDGTTHRWLVDVLDSSGDTSTAPAIVEAFGDGALLISDDPADPSGTILAALRTDEQGYFVRAGDWSVGDVDEQGALLLRITDAGIELGLWPALPVAAPTAPDETITIDALTIDAPTRTVLYRDDCTSCTSPTLWAPMVASDSTVVIADDANRRWIVVDGADGEAVTFTPMAPGVTLMSQPLLVGDDVYAAVQPSPGDPPVVQRYQLDDLGNPVETFSAVGDHTGDYLLSAHDDGIFVGEQRIADHDLLLPDVAWSLNQRPANLTVTWQGLTRRWEFASRWSVNMVGALPDGSVVITTSDAQAQPVVARLLPDGSFVATTLGTNHSFNYAVALTAGGIAQVELVDSHYEVVRYDLGD